MKKNREQQSRKLHSNCNRVIDSCFSTFPYFLDATNSNTICDTGEGEHAGYCWDEAIEPSDKDYTDTEGV